MLRMQSGVTRCPWIYDAIWELSGDRAHARRVIDEPLTLMIARPLLQHVPPVLPDMTMGEVFDLFTANPQVSALPIVHGTRPVGLITRKAIVEAFAKPYIRELFGKRDVRVLIDSNSSPLLAEVDSNLDDLSRHIVAAGMHHMRDGLILTERGAYAGMGTHPLRQAGPSSRARSWRCRTICN